MRGRSSTLRRCSSASSFLNPSMVIGTFSMAMAHSLRSARTQRRHRDAVSLRLVGLASLLSAVSRGILRMRRLHRIAAALPQGYLPPALLWLESPPMHQPELYSKECG